MNWPSDESILAVVRNPGCLLEMPLEQVFLLARSLDKIKERAASCGDEPPSVGSAEGEVATPGSCLPECTAVQLLSAFYRGLASFGDPDDKVERTIEQVARILHEVLAAYGCGPWERE